MLSGLLWQNVGERALDLMRSWIVKQAVYDGIVSKKPPLVAGDK